MSRRVAAALLATLVVLGLAVPSALGFARTPVLGWSGAFHNGAGFGKVRPHHVFLGGDPTGDVRQISWRYWGGGRALGFGEGWCPGRSVASGHPCLVALHVSGLSVCHGRRAYSQVQFYFQMGRSWTYGSSWNVCTGTANYWERS